MESDTPNRLHLKRIITVLSSELLVKSKQLKVLRQTVRRQSLKVSTMKDIIFKLQKQSLLNGDECEMLLDLENI